ncbi:MAG: hypothetical protein ABIM88_01745 [candidate division WOR-3 bacterium]
MVLSAKGTLSSRNPLGLFEHDVKLGFERGIYRFTGSSVCTDPASYIPAGITRVGFLWGQQ